MDDLDTFWKILDSTCANIKSASAEFKELFDGMVKKDPN